MLKLCGRSLKTMFVVAMLVTMTEFAADKTSVPSPTKAVVCWGLDQAKNWLNEKPEQTAVAESSTDSSVQNAGKELASDMSKVVQAYDANSAEYTLTSGPEVVAAPPESTNFKDYLLYGLAFMVLTGVSAKTLLGAVSSGSRRTLATVGAWRERRTILGLGDFSRLSSLIAAGTWLNSSERSEMTQLLRLKNMAANGVMLSGEERADLTRLTAREKSLAGSAFAFWANRIDAFLNRDKKLPALDRDNLRNLAGLARAHASKA